MLPVQATEILTFWFDNPDTPGNEYGQERRIWFRKNPELDQRVRSHFLLTYNQARQRGFPDWEQTARGALALVVLLDQFPRNMFRGTPRSFEADAQARAVAQGAIAQGYDQRVLPMERMFFYLPFEHSESLDDQDHAVRRFEDLIAEAPALKSTLQYAYRHREVIARFGRFPHRNAILGRTSTAAEIAFLQQPGSRF